MAYEIFATLYDQLMDEVPYYKWVEFIEEQVKSYSIEGKRLLDMGCGTGTLALKLIEKGYEVDGLDISHEMLTVARRKADEHNVNLPLYQQNMLDIEGFENYDVIGSFIDSLNYLNDVNEVKKAFENAYGALKPGGLFLFDVHSVYKVTEVFINNTFAEAREDISYIWNCFPGEEQYAVEHELTFFYREDAEAEQYLRYDELHKQRTYPEEIFRKLLAETGFQKLEMVLDQPENAERWFFSAQKPLAD